MMHKLPGVCNQPVPEFDIENALSVSIVSKIIDQISVLCRFFSLILFYRNSTRIYVNIRISSPFPQVLFEKVKKSRLERHFHFFQFVSRLFLFSFCKKFSTLQFLTVHACVNNDFCVKY